MPFCANCGEQYKDGDKFCPECGKQIQGVQKDSEENQHKTPKPVKKEMSAGVQLGMLTMTISGFVAIIAFLAGNRGVGFGGLKAVAIGLIIFVIAKWKNRKALIVSVSVIVILIVSSLINSAWQNRNVEIKQVTGKQCKICKTIIVADTTTIEKKYTDVRGKKFLYSYTDTLCSTCRSEGVKLFNEGKSQYYKGDFSLAIEKFKDAKLREYQDAESWLNKANKALKDKKANELAVTLKKLKKEYDDVSGVTWYKNRYFTHYNNRNLTSIYMGSKEKSTWLRLKMSYQGDDWIFFEQAYLSYDGNTKEISFNKYSDKESENSGGSVWEWIDVLVSPDVEKFLRVFAKSKNAKMRLSGKYSETRNLTWNEKQGIIDVLNGYDAIKRGIK